MTRLLRLVVGVTLAACTVPAAPPATLRADEELHTLPSLFGGTVRVLLQRPSTTARGLVLLYPGGDGLITLGAPAPFRAELVRRGYAVAEVEVPANAPSAGNQAAFQNFLRGRQIPQDAAAVLSLIGARYPAPVLLFGHDSGTVAATNVAANLSGDAHLGALVLASPQVPGITTLPLDRITVPVLLVQHNADTCTGDTVARYAAAFRASSRAALLTVSGGAPARPGVDPCAAAPHLFTGAQDAVAGAAVDWLEGRPVPAQIRP